MAARFEGLNRKQMAVLGACAINQDWGHHPDTLAALVRKGYLEEYEETLTDQRFPVRVKRYSVPYPVHIRWCEWCAAHPEPDDEVPA